MWVYSMTVKETLKKMIIKNLGDCASTFFIDKSLAIMDESADTKESFLAASDRISKRVALFIDPDLAVKLYDVLKVEIENVSAPSGTRRRHVRVAFRSKVFAAYNGFHYEFHSENLSEGGIFIRSDDPFPVGSEIVINLPLRPGADISIPGTVKSCKYRDDSLKHPPGMGIEFHKLSDEKLNILKSLVRKAAGPEVITAGGREDRTVSGPS
jgi:Tfp pilus assembly protein PilZ